LLEFEEANEVVSGIPGSVAAFGPTGFGTRHETWITVTPGATINDDVYATVGARPFAGVSLNPSPDWLSGLLDKVSRLSSLPSGWDGHRARPMSHRSLLAAVNFISQVAPHVRVGPAMVPTVSGGVALEWHRGDTDIEIEFPVAGLPTVSQSGPDLMELDASLESVVAVVVRSLVNLA
jgi:hypothetical protein